jgi:ribosomal protein L40E
MSLWDYLTDTAREELVAQIVGGLAASTVPEHLRAGLVRYFADGILPGGFLQAVLCNDLREAIARAAPGAVSALEPLVTFLEHHAPAIAWSSRDRVLAWTTTPQRLEIPAPPLDGPPAGGERTPAAALAIALLHQIRATHGPDVELADAPIPPAYVCPRCGARSWNPHDAEHKYCARCHAFEEP